MIMQFVKAQRKQAKLRLALTGASGSGKTYSALLMAKGMGGKIAVIDTERGSASLYSHLVDFDALELNPPYTPERFIHAINSAVHAGYDILIIDSLSHEWNGTGGCLELIDDIARAKFRGNTWSAWSELTPRHKALLDTIIQAPIHIISTMRSKTETSQVEENGRKKVVKLGMKTEQRDGTDYEFTTVLDIVHDGHFAVASKDRTGLFAGSDPEVISEKTGKKLIDWLNSGVEVLPEAKPDLPDEQTLIQDTINNMLNAKTFHDVRGIFGIVWQMASPNVRDKIKPVYDDIKSIAVNFPCADDELLPEHAMKDLVRKYTYGD